MWNEMRIVRMRRKKTKDINKLVRLASQSSFCFSATWMFKLFPVAIKVWRFSRKFSFRSNGNWYTLLKCSAIELNFRQLFSSFNAIYIHDSIGWRWWCAHKNRFALNLIFSRLCCYSTHSINFFTAAGTELLFVSAINCDCIRYC